MGGSWDPMKVWVLVAETRLRRSPDRPGEALARRASGLPCRLRPRSSFVYDILGLEIYNHGIGYTEKGYGMTLQIRSGCQKLRFIGF